MSKTLRNSGLHTAQEESELLVLKALASTRADGRQVALPLSALGFAAYPGYSFKAPQGAALAAAKLARSMQDRGLIGRNPGGLKSAGRGYVVRLAGIQALKAAQEIASVLPDSSLTSIQSAHVAAVFPEVRAQMAEFLKAGVDVVLARQTECGADVPPFCIAVASDQAFWVDCCETMELARSRAEALGLRVVELRAERGGLDGI